MASKSNTNERRPYGAVYLTACVFLLNLGLSYLLPRGGSIYSYGLIMQFAALLIPASLYMSLKGERLPQRMRINAFSPTKTIFLLLFVLAIFCGSVLYSLFFGGSAAENEIVSNEPAALSILCIAILPAFAEELIFRGILMTELEGHGPFTAVLLSSLLFAMLHFDLKMLPMYLFSGLMLALCAYVTRSLLASCAVHLAYNLLVFLGMEKLTAFFAITDDTALIGLILTVALLVSLILIFGECQRTYAVYSEQNAISSHAAGGGVGSFFIALLSPASIICIIVFIAAIII